MGCNYSQLASLKEENERLKQEIRLLKGETEPDLTLKNIQELNLITQKMEQLLQQKETKIKELQKQLNFKKL